MSINQNPERNAAGQRIRTTSEDLASQEYITLFKIY